MSFLGCRGALVTYYMLLLAAVVVARLLWGAHHITVAQLFWFATLCASFMVVVLTFIERAAACPQQKGFEVIV